MKKMAIICSGGDVSGMNAALKRFVEYALVKGIQPYFVHNGYEGLIDNEITPASYSDVSGIITRGGTQIGSSRSKRFMEATYRSQAVANLKTLNIDALVVLGGDGSFKGMHKLVEESNLAFCGIPATIDNDIAGTDYSLGVDTALNIIKDAIDAIRDTASSFRRAFVIETMGRECGYLALVSALTSGAEMCLIPEIPYDLSTYKSRFAKEMREGRSYFIAVVSEALSVSEKIAKWFENEVGVESRVTVLGHIQRGGNTSVNDRLMAYRFVTHAVDTLLDGNKSGVVSYRDGGFDIKSVFEVVSNRYSIPKELLQLGEEYNRH